MSIIPVGNRKDQVNQGPLQNQSILDSILFKKIGQGASALVPTKTKPGAGAPAPGAGGGGSDDMQQFVNETLDQGSLNHDQQADQHEQQVDPLNQAPQSPQGVEPAGGGSPASRFLGQDPDAEGQVDPNQLWAAERQKIRRFIGNDFGMDLTQGDDGTFTVSLKPPGNVPVQDPTGFMDSLLQHIGGGTVNQESTPAVSDAGGVLTLKYRPSGAGPQKVRPRGKRR